MEDKDLYKPLLDFPIIHGRFICNAVLSTFEMPEVSISDDLHIATVLDKPCAHQRTIEGINFKKGKVHVIVVDEYVKWITKIEALKNYIEENYNTLPKYFLYLDGIDTLILKDIQDPKQYLDLYKCKVLFNAEPFYHHTGFAGPTFNYFDSLYTTESVRYNELTLNKYKSQVLMSLNAGVFLGEKEYILTLLKEAYSLMTDDFEKGFPYGCMDDQCLLRYLHNEHFDDISADIFNQVSFWGCPTTFDETFNNYSIGYSESSFKNYINNG
jgi:hypothetical protein